MAVNSEVNKFINFHKHQLRSVPESLWEKLYNKLKNLNFDAGSLFQLHLDKIENTYTLHLKEGCCLEAGSDIFLIDHSWTTNPENAANELLNTHGLLDRMEDLFNLKNKDETLDEDDEVTKEQQEAIDIAVKQSGKTPEQAREALENHGYELVNAIAELTTNEIYNSEIMQNIQDTISSQIPNDAEEKEPKHHRMSIKNRIDRIVKHEMWKYIKVYQYTVLNDGEEENIMTWYFLDEVGNAIQHSDNPNIVCIPFIYNNGAENVAYSLFYPIKNICSGEMITQNKVPADIQKNENERMAYLTAYSNNPWEEMTEECEKLCKYRKEWQKKPVDISFSIKTPTTEIALEKPADLQPVKVYTDLLSIRFNIKDKNVKFVDDVNEADIIWIESEVETFKSNQKLSRFPNQICLTNPIYLKLMLSKTYGNDKSILPECYDLSTELAEFVGSYLTIEKEKENNKDIMNYWIIKPVLGNNGQVKPLQWIMTKSLSKIIRQRDTKLNIIVERYNNGQKPSLYNENVKYQLRFIVLLCSSPKGLSLYAYDKNFMVKLAGEYWDPNEDQIDNRSIHYVTYKKVHHANEDQNQTMNLNINPQKFIHSTTLTHYLETQHPQCSWSNIKAKIYNNIKDIFSAAISSPEPLGFDELGKTQPLFFSVYAIDVELTEDLSPYINNIEYLPDGGHMINFDKDFLVNLLGRVTDGKVGDIDEIKKSFVLL